MTIITLDTPVELPRVHFRDMDELASVLLQWRFEQELDESISAGKLLPENQLLNI